jgi:dTMP kinase
LITIEGVDGAGKSTLASGLISKLRDRGAAIEGLREPGGAEVSERIRELLADPVLKLGATAEALLYAAARAELVRTLVRPLLETGTSVLLDRFVDSSLAYQGVARGLGIESVREINLLATDGLVPDRTLLLRIDAARARERLHARGAAPDRLEAAGSGFFERVAAAYDALAAAEPERVRAIDASGDPATVLALALAQLEDLGLTGERREPTGPPGRAAD